MPEIDTETLADRAVLLGLVPASQMNQARDEAENGSVEALARTLVRKGLLTSWQRDKLLKGDVNGFFYGQFKVLFHIAEGTFARVYRGQHTQTGAPVAIKVLRRRFTSDASAVSRFAQEAEAGMRLVHPNIVRIYDYGEVERSHYMVMEYVEGSNLRDFLKLRGHLNAQDAQSIILGLAHGLRYSHEHQVTHRDIKGTNVLISSRREAKLVDFGLATVGDDRIAEFAHTRTVDYSALERTCGSPKGDPRSDIYFLGCVYYQLLTGVLPLPEVEASDPLAKMLKRSFGAIRPLAELRYAPPEGLRRIIEKMMTIALDKRYQTMSEVVADLEAYYGAGESSTAPAEPTVTDEDLLDAAFVRRPDSARTILCVETQDSIQEALKKSLSRMGYRVILVRDPERAAERYRESPSLAVIFDADGLGDDALDAFLDMHNKAHESGQPLTALVILGPRQSTLASQLPNDDRLIVLHKPLKMREVQDALQALVPAY
ncbi:MAG: protein kinase [Isosphaeraceae bacterium]|jgi:serine/threonine protein kinase|nr:MAG: protein kinase [Isosphaeraceae bacterium]